MTDDIDWTLLDRCWAGEETSEEAAELRRRRETWPEADRYLAAAERAMGLAEPKAGDWATETAWAGLAERTAIAPRPRVKAPVRLVARPSVGRALLKVAAAIALLGGVGGAWWFATMQSPAGTASVAMREYTTVRGQRAQMRLPDGTSVALGVASRLRVPADYGRDRRDVYLEGEAYFEVTHDRARPFAVHAGQAVARDLGTRFDVRAYAEDRGVEVVVAEGVVGLEVMSGTASGAGDFAPKLLTAGQLGRLDSAGLITVRRRVDVERYLSWTQGRLSFAGVPLRDMLPQLGRWYDLDLRLASPLLGGRRITLALKDEPVTQALDAIALLAHARYEQQGQIVTFYPITAGSSHGGTE